MNELILLIDKFIRRLRQREGKMSDVEPGKKFSDWLFIKLWVICAIKGWTANTLFAKLDADGKNIRKEFHLPTKLPSRSHTYERIRSRSFSERLKEFLHECIREALKLSPTEAVRAISMDLTPIEASLRDRGAAWGFSSKDEPFWGYKLGLVVTGGGVPLAFRLHKANKVEGNFSLPLIRDAACRLEETDLIAFFIYLLADAGFDSEKNYRAVSRIMKGIMLCPGRKKRKEEVKSEYHREYFAKKKYPFRTRALELYSTDLGRRLYRKRNIVEQVNGQLKSETFMLDRIPAYIRGLKKMRRFCLGKLIHFTLGLIANYAKERYNRGLKAYAA